MAIYKPEELRLIFRNKFDKSQWTKILHEIFNATELRATPELITDVDSTDTGYYLGRLSSSDHYEIGFFHYEIKAGSVANKRVGLRNLIKPFLRYEFDAALVVFDSGDHWRLSFICDIKEEATSPKRYTYVFGDNDNYYNTPIGRFIDLCHNGISFENLKNAFSVEALTKQFYNDLFEWYQWAVSENVNITFPNNTSIEDDDRENIDVKIIRMITRIMFVWFIKQKGLVPNEIFDEQYLNTILIDFNSQDDKKGTYYNAILQNLFFATLNRAIIDEDGKPRAFAKTTNSRDLKSLYRYSELFNISEQEIINLFSGVPFLNGGLFECLDKTRTIDGVEHAYNYDGFSRNDKTFADGRYRNRAVVPNILFFKPEKGLFPILSRYNFTIEENSPNEQQVALDPELLGKVFENLLGAYNPETRETARNQSGSFYTPREVVNYMVDESLMAYLGKSAIVEALFNDDFEKDLSAENEYQTIASKLLQIKILDPACGSGAFPMGLLNRMVDILLKITPNKSPYQLKLNIIENCIYGSDIQSIACQITKLRFFISLICDCEKDENKPNFGIPTLPNLETKFVAADSLIAKKKRALMGNLFENPEIDNAKKELADIRHKHFMAKSASSKRRLREKDQQLRENLAILLSNEDNFAPEDAKQLAAWNPYDQNAVSPFFDAEWMFGITDGFDLVIGNPPYVQLQRNEGKLAILYGNCGYQTFARTGDLYCLFYERGWQLLKKGGHLCYITSNKWMRAGYGDKTRGFFATKTNPKLLIDFGGVQIFESATVDTNILLFAKEMNKNKTICAAINKQDKSCINNLSDFVQHEQTICDFSSEESWVILSPIEQSIKRKIESVGTPLKDWDIQIYRGVLTGYNEAFIISTDKRNEILANCSTEDERKRTAELIRPILRGRDIKRYGYDWANLWLINTHNGIRGVKPRIYIEDYPAVKAHLDQYYPNLSKRADKGDTPYNLRNCAYLEDFSKPKIMWAELARTGNSFIYNNEKIMAIAGAFLLTMSESLQSDIGYEFLTMFLNCPIALFYFDMIYSKLDNTGWQWKKEPIEKLPIPLLKKNKQTELIKLYNLLDISDHKPEIEALISLEIYRLYNLNFNEIKSIYERTIVFQEEFEIIKEMYKNNLVIN